MRARYSDTRSCTSRADRFRSRTPLELQVHHDVGGALASGDLRGTARETGDALHLLRRIARVPRENLGRDDRRLHQADRTTSSVTSGRAKSRKGTKVVPRPAETCSVVDPYS